MNRRTRRGLMLGICLFGALDSFGQRVTVETFSDEVTGRLERLGDRHGVRLTGDSNVSLSPAEVLSVRFDEGQREPELADALGTVTLTNGSRLAYQSVEFLGEQVRLRLVGDADVLISAELLSEWWLASDDSGSRAEPDSVEAADVLFVRRPQGEVVPVAGVVMGMEQSGVRFALDGADAGEPVAAPWSRLAGIRFYRGGSRAKSGDEVVIELTGGDRIVAESVAYRSPELVWNGTASEGRCPVTSVASIDLSAGRVVAISGLDRVSQRWKPFFETTTSDAKGYNFDLSRSGKPLALRWPDPRAPGAWPEVHTVRQYQRGAAIRSACNLQFALPDGARRLKGWIGIDPQTAGVGSAEVSILADDRTVWSGTVDGDTRPAEVNAELLQARRLSIRVDYGDNLDAGDNVHFAELRVVR